MRPPGASLCIIFAFLFFFAVSCGGATQNDTPQQTDESSTTPQTSMESTMMDETAMDTTMMESSNMEATGMESSTMDETTVEEAPPEVVVVKMSGLKFEPARVEISPGTTVRWENVEQAEHNVTSEDDDGPLKSDTFRAGGSYEYTFEEQGEFDYLCTIHPFMKGIVIVS